MYPIEFYRNSGKRTKYHHPGKNWVNDGKALCGADIRHAGFTTSTRYANGFPDNHPLCKHCKRMLEQ